MTLHTLALSSGRANDLFRQVGPWLAMLAALVIVGSIALLWIRRRMRADDSQDAPFTLDALRRLHRDGKLTDAEFKKARDVIVAAARKSIKRDPAAAKTRRPPR